MFTRQVSSITRLLVYTHTRTRAHNVEAPPVYHTLGGLILIYFPFRPIPRAQPAKPRLFVCVLLPLLLSSLKRESQVYSHVRLPFWVGFRPFSSSLFERARAPQLAFYIIPRCALKGHSLPGGAFSPCLMQ